MRQLGIKTFAVLLCLCATAALAQELTREEAAWLDQVEPLLSSTERDLFLELPAAERPAFIREFWAARDPVPSTQVNEFQDEFLRRVEYVKQHFHGAKDGVRTDRGWAYIVLGPPRSVQSFAAQRNLFPLEIWEYRAEGRPDLPPVFHLLFYQPMGVGDYRLYDPGADGPASLVPQATNRSWRPLEVYQWLRRIDPGLARASLSIDATEPVDELGGQPSLQASGQLARLRRVAELHAPDAYARRWRSGQVEARASFDAEVFPARGAVFRGPDGGAFLVASMRLPPEFLVFESVGGDCVLSFHLEMSPLDEAGRELGTLGGRQEVHLAERQLEQVRREPLEVFGVWAVAPSARRARLWFRQEQGGRALARAELAWPEIASPASARLSLSEPLLGTAASPGASPRDRDGLLPRVGLLEAGEPAWISVQVYGPAGDSAPPGLALRVRGPAGQSLDWPLRGAFDPSGVLEALAPLPARLPPGAQRWSLELLGVGSDGPAARSLDFEVGAPLAWQVRVPSEPLDSPLHPLRRALQMWQAGQRPAALAELDKSLASEAPPSEALLAKARLLLELRRARELSELLEPRLGAALLSTGPLDPDTVEMLGLSASASVLRRDFLRASELYARAFAAAPGSTRLLNAWAATEQAQGRLAKAAELYRQSLKIDPEQAKLKPILEGLMKQSEKLPP